MIRAFVAFAVLMLATVGAQAQSPVSVIGPITPGDCPQFNSTTVIKDSGTPCNGGAGGFVKGPSVTSPGDLAIWNNTTGTLLADSGAQAIPAVFNPINYGAVGDNTHDDTSAWINMCTAVAAAGGGQIVSPPGKTYKVWLTAPTNGSILCNLANVNGLRIYMQGSEINVAYSTGTSVVYVFSLFNSQQIEIDDLVGVSAAGKQVSGATIGTFWIAASNEGGSGFGFQGLTVHRANITGGIGGVNVARIIGTGQWSTNLWVDGTFANVGYPVANENDGLNTYFDIVTVNAGRSYDGYNMWGVRGRINSTTGNSLNDVALGCNGFQGDISNSTFANVDIEYVNRASTTYGSSLISLGHSQADPVHSNLTCTVSNVHLKLDVAFNSTPATEILNEGVFTGNGTSPTPGDPGGTDDNIVIEGKVEGDVSSTYLGCIMTPTSGSGCTGYAGVSTGTYNLSNLQILTSTKPWIIGVGASITFQNYSQPNGNFPTFDGGYVFSGLSLRQPVTFANTGSTPIQGTTNFRDPSGQNVAFSVNHGNVAQWFNGSDAIVGGITGSSGNFDLLSSTTVPLRLGYNNTLYWNLTTGGLLQPVTDNASAIGDSSHRPSTVYGVVGKFNSLVLPGASSGTLTQTAPSAAGSAAIAWGTASGTPAVTASAPLAINTTTGNITCSTCATGTITSEGASDIAYYSGASTISGVSITGLVLGQGATAPTAYGGGSCTNQFFTALNASGSPTCTSVSNSYLSSGSYSNITGIGTLSSLTISNGSVSGPVFSLSATGSNFGGNYVGMSVGTNNTSTSAQAYYNNSFIGTMSFNSGSNTSLLTGTTFQQYVSIQSGATPSLVNTFLVLPDTYGASPTGTLATWNQFAIAAIGAGHSGTPSMTITSYSGLNIANANANAISGLTLTTNYGAYIAGQTAGTTGIGLYVDSGSTTAAILVNDATDASSSSTGSVQLKGGLGIAKKIVSGSSISATSGFISNGNTGLTQTCTVNQAKTLIFTLGILTGGTCNS